MWRIGGDAQAQPRRHRHAGHGQIQQYEVEGALVANELEGLIQCPALRHLCAGLFIDETGQRLANQIMVVSNKYSRSHFNSPLRYYVVSTPTHQ